MVVLDDKVAAELAAATSAQTQRTPSIRLRRSNETLPPYSNDSDVSSESSFALSTSAATSFSQHTHSSDPYSPLTSNNSHGGHSVNGVQTHRANGVNGVTGANGKGKIASTSTPTPIPRQLAWNRDSPGQNQPPAWSHSIAETSTPIASGSNSAASSNASLVPPTWPTNYLSVSRNNGSIRGTFKIDPSLPSAEPLAELPKGEVRKNCALAVVNGAIKVDLLISAPQQPTRSPPRCLVHLNCRNSSASVRIPNPGHPVSLHLSLQNGSAHLRLPRTFIGPLTFTNRSSALGASPALSQRLTVLSDPSSSSSRARHAFIGDYRGAGWSKDPKGWQGDELVLDIVNAGVRVSFVDDPDDPEVVSSSHWTSVLGSVM